MYDEQFQVKNYCTRKIETNNPRISQKLQRLGTVWSQIIKQLIVDQSLSKVDVDRTK